MQTPRLRDFVSHPKEAQMEWHSMCGCLSKLRGAIRESWERLTDADLDVVSSSPDKLRRRLQRRYGYSRAEAQAAIDDFVERILVVGEGGWYVPEHP